MENSKEMKEWKEYYKKTKKNNPSESIRRFFLNNYNKNFQGNIAIDLGCGTGNDTEFLISKGFKVTAVDNNEQVKEILDSRNLDIDNLKIIIDDFSKIDLPKTDLVNANFSMHFVKENFNEFIVNLSKSYFTIMDFRDFNLSRIFAKNLLEKKIKLSDMFMVSN